MTLWTSYASTRLWLTERRPKYEYLVYNVWSRNPNFLFTSLLPFAIAHVCICRTKKSMNTCKISKSLSKFLWNFSFTKEEVCFPVNICLPIVTCSTFVFLERTRSRHWRTFTIVWSIRNYFFYFTFLFLLQKISVILPYLESTLKEYWDT